MTLEEAMESRGITPELLAAFMGVTRHQAKSWSDHRARIHPHLYGRLREALGMSRGEFSAIIADLKREPERPRRFKKPPRVRKYPANMCFACSPEMKRTIGELARIERMKPSKLIRITMEQLLRREAGKIKKDESKIK